MTWHTVGAQEGLRGRATAQAELSPGLCGPPHQLEPTGSLTPFPGKQESLLTWPRPLARQKFLFSAKHGRSCQLDHRSIRQAPGRGEALYPRLSLRCRVTRPIQLSKLLWRSGRLTGLVGRRGGRQRSRPTSCLDFSVPWAVTPTPNRAQEPQSAFCAPVLQAAHKGLAVRLSLAHLQPCAQS